MMTFADGVRLWFILVFSLAFVGSLVGVIRMRSERDTVEQQVGPLPTPIGMIFQIIGLLLLATRIGEIPTTRSTGWVMLRVLGVSLSLYGLAMLQWATRALGPSGAPGPAVFRDHKLITSGPYRLVRHPGYSALFALWLGMVLGTLNWLLLALWPVVMAGFYLNSRAEERLLREKFGAAYEEYAQHKDRFIPGVW
jgi:protein-S-isoprenylcysteine O-methyltransferase Ste14